MTSAGIFKEEVIEVAHAKIAATPLQAVVSGIGCNWFVGLALWLCYGASDATGKLLGTWFPVMTFVALGFQHSVANAFVIPAAILKVEQLGWTLSLTLPLSMPVILLAELFL